MDPGARQNLYLGFAAVVCTITVAIFGGAVNTLLAERHATTPKRGPWLTILGSVPGLILSFLLVMWGSPGGESSVIVFLTRILAPFGTVGLLFAIWHSRALRNKDAEHNNILAKELAKSKTAHDEAAANEKRIALDGQKADLERQCAQKIETSIAERDKGHQAEILSQGIRLKSEAKHEQEAAIRETVSAALADREKADADREARRDLVDLIDVRLCVDPSRSVVYQRGSCVDEPKVHVEFCLRFSNRSTHSITMRQIDTWSVQISWQDGLVTLGPAKQLRTLHLDRVLDAGAKDTPMGDTIKDDLIVSSPPPSTMLGCMQVVGRLTSGDDRSMIFQANVAIQLVLGYTKTVGVAAARIKAGLQERGISLADADLRQVKGADPGVFGAGWYLVVNPTIEVPCDTYDYHEALTTSAINAVVERASAAIAKKTGGTK